MAMPDYQSIMLPLLELPGRTDSLRLREAIDTLGEHFSLSDDERRQLVSSGKQPIFDNRVGWTSTHLSKAGMLQSLWRGGLAITEMGRKVRNRSAPPAFLSSLQPSPQGARGIKEERAERLQKFLLESRQKSMRSFWNAIPISGHSGSCVTVKTSQQVRNQKFPARFLPRRRGGLTRRFALNLVRIFLAQSRAARHSFLGNWSLTLTSLRAAEDPARRPGRPLASPVMKALTTSSKEDRLGLGVIYLQAKRRDAVVGRPDIQKFADALHWVQDYIDCWEAVGGIDDRLRGWCFCGSDL